jgi:hypothetical protein
MYKVNCTNFDEIKELSRKREEFEKFEKEKYGEKYILKICENILNGNNDNNFTLKIEKNIRELPRDYQIELLALCWYGRDNTFDSYDCALIDATRAIPSEIEYLSWKPLHKYFPKGIKKRLLEAKELCEANSSAIYD